jgi:large subunit ribosomal protein L30
MSKIKITLKRSPIGYEKSQGATAKMLGFKKLQQTVIQEDSPAILGMIHKIRHLVEVEPVTEE